MTAASNVRPIRKKSFQLRARTPNQQEYIDLIENKHIVFATGSAGSGKSFLAIAKAVEALQKGAVTRIILIRPVVEAGEKLGFLPGTYMEKLDPYLKPLYDALIDIAGTSQLEDWLRQGVIEVAPIAYLRGRTLNDSFIILDEAQNATAVQLKLVLTRLGKGSKLIINGDYTQSDISNSGLDWVIHKLIDISEIGMVRFESYDVQRSRVVALILEALEV